MKPQFIDLHTHTTASDGSDAPAEVVAKAASLGIVALAVTDHDTISGLVEAEEAGHRLGVEVIRGCELSVRSECGEVHLLGLWLPQNAGELEATLINLRDKRHERNERILTRLSALGLALSATELEAEAGGESVGRPHIARAMQRKGYVSNSQEAFSRYLGKDCPAFEPKEVLEPEEGVRVLSSLGATVSFAHPMLLRCPRPWLDTFVERLKAVGLDAVEAYHSEHDAEKERDAVALAARHNLALTGGSDYHGVTKPQVHLGHGKGGLRVVTAVLDRLKELRRKKGLPV